MKQRLIASLLVLFLVLPSFAPVVFATDGEELAPVVVETLINQDTNQAAVKAKNNMAMPATTKISDSRGKTIATGTKDAACVIKQNGIYTATATSGEVEKTQQFEITTLDNSAPVITFTGAEESEYVTITIADIGTSSAEMQYQFAGNEWLAYTKPIMYQMPGDGSTVEIAARDKWGNTTAPQPVKRQEYYSEEIANKFAKEDAENAEKGNITHLWMDYMVKWGKAIPYEPTPEGYEYQQPEINPRGRAAAATTIGELPMGAKIVDAGTKWGNQPLIWVKVTDGTVQPRTIKEEPYYRYGIGEKAYDTGVLWSSKDTTKNYFLSEASIGEFPLNTAMVWNEIWDMPLARWMNEPNRYDFLEMNFYMDILSSDLRKAMVSSCFFEKWADDRAPVNDAYVEDSYAYVTFPMVSNRQETLGTAPRREASGNAAYVETFVHQNNMMYNTQKTDYYPSIGGDDSKKNLLRTLRYRTYNSQGIYTKNYTSWDVVSGGSSYHESADHDATIARALKPEIALKTSTKVFAVPDSNGVYTLVPSLTVPTATQSFSAATNKSTITAGSPEATQMQISYGGSVVATASANTITYAATKNGTYTATATSGATSLTTTISVTAVDDAAPIISSTALPTGWATSKAVTISLSDTTASGMQYQISGGTWQSYNAPFAYSFTANSTITVTARDKWSNTSTTKTISANGIDITPPTIAAMTKSPPKLWHNADVTITISGGTDTESGIKGYQYQVGDSAWQNYNIPLIIEDSAAVKAKTVDNVGNASALASIAVWIDREKPYARHTLSKTSWTNSTIQITVTADDDSSGVASITLPDKSAVATSTANYIATVNGTYTFVIADEAGNSFNYDVVISNIEAAPPTATHRLDPDAWTNGAVRITVTAEDDSSGVATIALPDGTTVTGSSEEYTVTKNDTYTFIATDVAGNILNYNVVVDKIDITAPTIEKFELKETLDSLIKGKMLLPFTEKLFKKQVELVISALDDASGVEKIEYAIMRGEELPTEDDWHTYITWLPARITEEMAAGVYVRAFDTAGNKSAVVSINTIVDGTAPIGSHKIEPESWTNGTVKITVSAQDAMTNVQAITLPNYTEIAAEQADFEVAENGDYAFVLSDTLGNATNYFVTVNNIDTTPPTPPAIEVIKPVEKEWSEEPTEIDADSTAPSGILKYQYKVTDITPPQGKPRMRVLGEAPKNNWQDSSHKITVEEEGIYQVEVRAVSVAENISPTSNYIVRNDYTSPVAASMVDGQHIKIVASDQLSGVAKISWSKGEVMGGVVELDMEEYGTKTFEITDYAGNKINFPVTTIAPVPPSGGGGNEGGYYPPLDEEKPELPPTLPLPPKQPPAVVPQPEPEQLPPAISKPETIVIGPELTMPKEDKPRDVQAAAPMEKNKNVLQKLLDALQQFFSKIINFLQQLYQSFIDFLRANLTEEEYQLVMAMFTITAVFIVLACIATICTAVTAIKILCTIQGNGAAPKRPTSVPKKEGGRFLKKKENEVVERQEPEGPPEPEEDREEEEDDATDEDYAEFDYAEFAER